MGSRLMNWLVLASYLEETQPLSSYNGFNFSLERQQSSNCFVFALTFKYRYIYTLRTKYCAGNNYFSNHYFNMLHVQSRAPNGLHCAFKYLNIYERQFGPIFQSRLLAFTSVTQNRIQNNKQFERQAYFQYQTRNASKDNLKLPSSARVVVCGGGVVGTSVAYHIAEKGWKDVVLLEQGR